MPARPSDDYRDPDPGSDDPGQAADTRGTATTSVTWRQVGNATTWHRIRAEVEWAEPVWLSRYRSRLSRAVTGGGWLLLIETQA